MLLKSGKYRGEKILYPDGVGCCIWLPFDEDETAGLAYDFSYEDIDDIINLLQMIKQVEPEVFQDDEPANTASTRLGAGTADTVDETVAPSG